jgi:hypothetical protein
VLPGHKGLYRDDRYKKSLPLRFVGFKQKPRAAYCDGAGLSRRVPAFHTGPRKIVAADAGRASRCCPPTSRIVAVMPAAQAKRRAAIGVCRVTHPTRGQSSGLPAHGKRDGSADVVGGLQGG